MKVVEARVAIEAIENLGKYAVELEEEGIKLQDQNVNFERAYKLLLKEIERAKKNEN